jgi:AcrR family transcriptional regulator
MKEKMTKNSPTSKAKPKSVGRPAKLSQQHILDTALVMLREGGGQALSIRKLAQSLNTVPGNIYTYFASKEALLDALAEFALQSMDIVLNEKLAWDAQIQQWMENFRQALKEKPELMFLIGLSGTSPSTLRKIQRIAQLMQNAGLDEASAILNAQGLLWTVMSFSFFESQASDPKVIKQLKQTGNHEEYRDVMCHLAVDNLEPLWQATLSRNIDGIRLQILQQK